MGKLNKHKYILHALANCNKKIRKGIISNSNKEVIDSICDCVFNVVSGNIKIDDKHKKKLKIYNKTFKNLLTTKNLKKRKDILIQKGGFLQYLIPALVSGVASIVSAIISKKSENE
jgi:hypothetical protein